MLLVKTRLGVSPIHGIGVFLMEPVKKGTPTWKYDTRIDRVYCEDEFASLPADLQEFLRFYSTWHQDTRQYVLCGDNGRHMNHSETPNTVSDAISFGMDFAAEDLEPGVELTSDYRTICDNSKQHGPF